MRILLFLFLHLTSHCHSIRTQLPKNPSLCSLDCSNSRKRPVCGSDGVTYSSRCELDKASCRTRNLRVGYRGECFSVKERCFEERRSAMKTSNESGIAIFIPECHPNGNYVNVQCHYGTGYCWCVNQVGKPVPGSSVRYKKPKCNKKAKRKRSRRGKKGTRKRHAKRICSQSDRMQFNNYVIEIITSEFRKSGQVIHTSTHYHSRKSNPKKEMVDWKFRELDTDSNGIIKRREFGDFRKGVKRMSRNKQCAVTFWRYCDMNNDKKMTPTEWNTCLGVDVNVSFRLFLSLNAKEDPLKQRQDRVKAKEKPSFVKSQSILNSGRQTSMDTLKEDNSNQKVKGCRQGRSKTSSIGSEDAFVPECTSNGKYQRVQCFTSTGYCWCADEETGAPIPGTSIRNARPRCSDEDIFSRIKEASSNDISTGRAWKKCPEPQKQEFQKNLIQIFKILYSRSHQAHNEHAGNLEKKIVQWQFHVMDRNRDGLLSKKELKSLRVKIKKDHRLRRCGKRLPIHCDIDQSSSISLSEWEICIGIEDESSQSSSIGSIGGKRRGVNPLKKYLKSD